MSDLCAGTAGSDAVRGRLLGWLAEGAREVNWVLCSVPRERWTTQPAAGLSAWPVLRHARYVALREQLVTLPGVRQAFGEPDAEPSTLLFEQTEAAWDPDIDPALAEEVVRDLGAARFDLLRYVEAAPETAWVDVEWTVGQVGRPPRLVALLLNAKQQELEHLAAMWRIALHWDRVSPSTLREAQDSSAGLPLHPADTA